MKRALLTVRANAPWGNLGGVGELTARTSNWKVPVRLPHSPCPDGKSGGPWKDWERRKWRREQAEVTGYFSAGRGYKRRGCLKVTEVVLLWKLSLFCPLFLSHCSAPLKLTEKQEHHDLQGEERGEQVKMQALCLVLGSWEKSPDSRGESEEHTYCTLQIESFVYFWAQNLLWAGPFP